MALKLTKRSIVCAIVNETVTLEVMTAVILLAHAGVEPQASHLHTAKTAGQTA